MVSPIFKAGMPTRVVKPKGPMHCLPLKVKIAPYEANLFFNPIALRKAKNSIEFSPF